MRRLIYVAALLLASGCTEKTAELGWREVSRMDGGFIRIVEISPDRVSDPSVYREAAARLCSSGSECFQLGFFPVGAPYPRETSRGDFFRNGGWGPYDELAMFIGSTQEFTKWDCARIGPDDAPEGALCGEGEADAYKAALTLGARVGFVTGCGAPATDDEALFLRFADTQSGRKEQLVQAFESMKTSTSDGPDDPAMCAEVTAKNEANAREARTLIERALEAGS